MKKNPAGTKNHLTKVAAKYLQKYLNIYTIHYLLMQLTAVLFFPFHLENL